MDLFARVVVGIDGTDWGFEALRQSLTLLPDEGSVVQPEVAGRKLEPTQPGLASYARYPHRRPLLGLGSGDRFEHFRGGSRSFEEGFAQPQKPGELQGKRSTKRPH